MPNSWKWRPEVGRWHPVDHGHPVAPVPIAVSTDGAKSRNAYDYWRNFAFPDFEPDNMAREDKLAFSARASGFSSKRADFFMSESAGLSGGRTQRQIDRDGLDSISIGIVSQGQRQVEIDDQRIVTRTGGVYIYDAARPSRVAWSDHKTAFLVVRRADAEAAFGTDVPGPVELMARLEASSMRHVLIDQFRLLSRHMPYVANNEQAYLLDQAVRLALFTLARQDEAGTDNTEDQDLLLTNAALRFIETYLPDPNLTIERITKAVGCSRATLYRAFAAQGMGVAEAIRDARLDRAKVLLEQGHVGISIADIALRCGLYDTANFSRQFRRRFGFAPSDLRRIKR